MNPSRRGSVDRLVIDASGWAACDAAPIERVASPNFDARPDDAEPSLIVVHNISLPPRRFGGRWIDALFTNTLDFGAHPYFAGLVGLRVSAHFLIRRSGTLAQFVSCAMRAWHAGASCFEGRERCNDFSIGIELEGDDESDFDDLQYDRLHELIEALRERFPITAIAGHSDIAPGRKTDPGPHFDWSRALSGQPVSLQRRPASDP